MKKEDFKIGQRVHHPEYGDGTVMRVNHPEYGDGRVMQIEPRNVPQYVAIWFDNEKHERWPVDYHLCTPIDPEYKYGEEVEMTDADEWPTVPAKGWYGLLDPDGGGHWITNGSIMQRWKHVRRPVKEPTPREEFEKATKCRSHDDIMKAGDRYVERTLTAEREKWEKDNPRLICPTWEDINACPEKFKLISDALKWLFTPEGQEWMKERKEGNE